MKSGTRKVPENIHPLFSGTFQLKYVSGYFTVTFNTAFFPLALFTAMAALPFLLALITPFFVTVTTFLFELVKVNFSVPVFGLCL